MTEEEKRKHRCRFTGHRTNKLGMSEAEIKERTRKAVRQTIEDSFVTFISGMAIGFDLYAAEVVLEEKKTNPDIHLICASPYEGFEKRWSDEDKKRYYDIMAKADYVKFVCDHYSRSCFQLRNIYMVDRSARIISAYNGSAGGTRNTIEYATRKGVEVFNILYGN